jgi:hypothetical protein
MKPTLCFLNLRNANFLILVDMIPLTLMDLLVFLEELTSIQMIYSKCSLVVRGLLVVSGDLVAVEMTIYLVHSQEEEVDVAVHQADSLPVFQEDSLLCPGDQEAQADFLDSHLQEVAEVEDVDNRIRSALGVSASD